VTKGTARSLWADSGSMSNVLLQDVHLLLPTWRDRDEVEDGAEAVADDDGKLPVEA
jgi:hypothetical protein